MLLLDKLRTNNHLKEFQIEMRTVTIHWVSYKDHQACKYFASFAISSLCRNPFIFKCRMLLEESKVKL